MRDIDRQYEINNNGELDNGVYNKFVNNSFREENEEEKGNFEQISNETRYDVEDGKEHFHLLELMSTGTKNKTSELD